MARLGDICTVISGSTPKTSVEEYWDGDIKWITPAEINEDSFYITDTVRHITKRGKCDTGLTVMPIGTVILSSRAPIGKTAIAGCEMCCNQGFKNLICSDKIYNEYLYFFLKGKTDFLNSLGRGATFKEISKSIVEDIDIPLPDYATQMKTALQMRKIESIILLRKQQLSKLDELVKSRFIEMFDGKGYPQVTIGELVTYKVPSVKKSFAPTDLIKYIDISSIDNIRNVMTGYTEYVLQEAPSRAQQHIKTGDIVISTVRPNLKNVAITTYEDDNLVASSGFCVLRANKCLPSYLMAIVCSEKFTEAMIKLVTGANYPAIKDSDVLNYVVALPPIKIQEQFATFVDQVDKSKFEIQKSLEKLETLKKALMQKYFW